MKGRLIVLTAAPCHAALLEDGRVEDLLLCPKPGMPEVGDIRTAKVTRKLASDGAAFMDLDGGLDGYLREGKGLRSGDMLPVMVSGLPEPGKAYPVTSRLLIKGRALILTPGRPGVNVSRQIKDPDERERLSAAVTPPDDETGIIVRSVAKDMEAAQLSAECAHLTARLAEKTPPETPDQTGPLTYALREWTGPTPDMIAAPEALEQLLDWESAPGRFHHDPDLADALRFGDGDPFDHFGVWDEIERLRTPRTDLPSGGWMAIEATRAMVTVDVNTGDGFGGGDAMTTNVEAARELPRQLRLRGLGGQVIVDFAPLKKQHRKKIEETLKSAFRRDPIDTTLAGWTPLGNFELQRKRERRPISELL